MIREYRLEDMDRIWELSHDIGLPFWQFKEAVITGKVYVYENVHSTLRGPTIYGFIVGLMDGGNPWLWWVTVSRFCRNRGIATQLIHELESYYKGKELHLYVEENNPAQKLYFDLGYRVVGMRNGIYKNSNAIELKKDLNGGN